MNIYNLAYNSAESQWLMPELIFAETSEAEIITLAGENGDSINHRIQSCNNVKRRLFYLHA